MPLKLSQLPKLALAFFIIFIGGFVLIRTDFFGHFSQLHSSSKKGDVVVVYDGDTIKVRFEDGSERKVRLVGIDSPEAGDEREDVRFFAYIAKRFSFDHLYRKAVRLTFDWEREDKYGRLLAYIWFDGDILFNEFILKEGFASAFLKFPFKDEYRRRFIQAERTARQEEKGLWQKEPIPTVSSSEAAENTGKYISVKFKCTSVRSRGRFVFLNSQDAFSALIPRNSVSLFPSVKLFRGQLLTVKGYLEDYKGKPQIILFLPLQIGRDS
jgi:micrococcal nuclease